MPWRRSEGEPPRIAVVGRGVVSPFGEDIDVLWRQLMDGASAVRRSSFEAIPDFVAAPVDTDVSEGLSKLQQVGTERVSQMALRAARAAIRDAGIGQWADRERVGLFLGTGMGGAATMDAGYAALHGGRRIPPLTVPTGMVNGAAAIVAMHCGIAGPVLTYAVACASSAAAILEAAHALLRGDVDIAIAGGVEAILTRGTVAAWQALRTLAQVDAAHPERSCRPFSPDRSGLVLGEGAGFLVLARDDGHTAGTQHAAAKAYLSGGAIRCDASHLTNPSVDGQVATLRAALKVADLQPADVGYCNAHGTATLAGDPVECESMRRVWGDAAPALRISSTKAAHGHLLGAAGGLEAVLTTLALQRQEVPPTAGTRELDPSCVGLCHVLGSGERLPGLEHAVSNSFAFGGTNVSLVFSRCA